MSKIKIENGLPVSVCFSDQKKKVKKFSFKNIRNNNPKDMIYRLNTNSIGTSNLMINNIFILTEQSGGNIYKILTT